MTIDELIAREAIRDTMAQYNTSGDRLRVDAFADCFTEDGVIESERTPGHFAFRYEGREGIRAWQQRWLMRDDGPETAADTVHGATFVRHHLSTSKIDLTGPDSAQVRTYWAAWTDIGPDHAGYYLDSFRRVGDRWLIARRRVRLDWSAPGSLFVSAIVNSAG